MYVIQTENYDKNASKFLMDESVFMLVDGTNVDKMDNQILLVF